MKAPRGRPRWHMGTFLAHKAFIFGLCKLMTNKVFLSHKDLGVTPCHTYSLIFYNKSNNVNSPHKLSGFSALKSEREVHTSSPVLGLSHTTFSHVSVLAKERREKHPPK